MRDELSVLTNHTLSRVQVLLDVRLERTNLT